MGWLADQYHSMANCFILPLIGFIAPAIYGLVYPRLLHASSRAPRREAIPGADAELA
jgi:hypothetical protein